MNAGLLATEVAAALREFAKIWMCIQVELKCSAVYF